VGEIDDPHPACAQDALDLVPADLCGKRGWLHCERPLIVGWLSRWPGPAALARRPVGPGLDRADVESYLSRRHHPGL
jgi:hypothetical protein